MTENPRVDRYLQDKTFDRMDHALGRHFDPQGQTFRNYFATDARGDLAATLKASPWWQLSACSGTMEYFKVTPAGKAALKVHLEEHSPIRAYIVSFHTFSRALTAKSRGQAKYKYWLDIRELDDDLTFVKFCSIARVRSLQPTATISGAL